MVAVQQADGRMTAEPTSSLSPPAPPATEEDRLTWLRLLRSRRVGPTTFHRLLADHGSAAAALEALPAIRRPRRRAPDYRPCPEAVAGAELRAARRAGAVPLFNASAGLSRRPLPGSSTPPPSFGTRGRASLLARPNGGAGWARASGPPTLGLRMAPGGLAPWTSRRRPASNGGLGPRPGHRRRRPCRGPSTAGTIAVLAGGVDVVYPPENLGLSDSIAQKRTAAHRNSPRGLEPPGPAISPARNRIVSGLAAVVVRGRGGGTVGLPHHRPHGARPGAGGRRRARSPDGRPCRGQQPADPATARPLVRSPRTWWRCSRPRGAAPRQGPACRWTGPCRPRCRPLPAPPAAAPPARCRGAPSPHPRPGWAPRRWQRTS